jgi:hypothetical protein
MTAINHGSTTISISVVAPKPMKSRICGSDVDVNVLEVAQ